MGCRASGGECCGWSVEFSNLTSCDHGTIRLTSGNSNDKGLVVLLQQLREGHLISGALNVSSKLCCVCDGRQRPKLQAGTCLSSISSTSGNASPALTERMLERWNERLPLAAMAERRRGETRCNITIGCGGELVVDGGVCFWRRMVVSFRLSGDLELAADKRMCRPLQVLLRSVPYTHEITGGDGDELSRGAGGRWHSARQR